MKNINTAKITRYFENVDILAHPVHALTLAPDEEPKFEFFNYVEVDERRYLSYLEDIGEE
jgi:hypothetical protein